MYDRQSRDVLNTFSNKRPYSSRANFDGQAQKVNARVTISKWIRLLQSCAQ